MTEPKRILVVEDEVLIALCLEMELKNAGYTVPRSIACGEEAVTIARQEPPDVILMDIRLAGEIDGLEAVRQIQAFRDIPVIFITGYPNKDLEERARVLHPLGYFVKPVSTEDLQRLIDTV